MSVLTLPEPANWPAGNRRLLWSSVLMVAFVAVGGFTGMHLLGVGDYPGAVVSMGFLVPILLGVLALQLVASGRTSMRATHDMTATMFRPDRTFVTLMLTMFGMAIPWAIAILYFTLTGKLGLAGFRHGSVEPAVLSAGVMTSAAAGLIAAWRRRGVGYVKLTPLSIEIADILRTESVSWSDVVAVDDHSESNKKTRKAIVLRFQDGTEKTIDGADFYVPNGVGLYWMVRHYWLQPDDRAELADDRALERLRGGRFDTRVP